MSQIFTTDAQVYAIVNSILTGQRNAAGGLAPLNSEGVIPPQFVPPSGDFKGAASPSTDPGSPSVSVWYMATESGTYTDFDGITVTSSDGLNLLSFTPGVGWVKAIIPIDLSEYATSESVTPVKNAVRIDRFGARQLSDNSLMTNQRLQADGTIISASNNWICLPYQPVPAGDITVSGYGTFSAETTRYVVKDSLGNVVESELGSGGGSTPPITITIPGDGHEIAFNIASGSNVFLNVDTFRNQFMLNSGEFPLAFEPFTGQDLIKKESINFDFQSVALDKDVQEINKKIDPFFEITPQLLDAKEHIQSGSYNTSTGDFAPSNNWCSIKRHPLEYDGEQTLSGFGPASNTIARVLFWDAAGTFMTPILSVALGNFDPVTFTPPVGAVEYAINIAGVVGIGLDVENSPYLSTLMLNKGDVASEFAPFGSIFLGDASLVNTVWMSPSGNDSNSGLSLSFPVASFSRANEILKGQGELVLMEGDYFDLPLDLSSFNVMKAARGVRVRLIYGTRISSATLSSGYTRVYEAAHIGSITNTFYLWQHDVEDEDTVISEAERHVFHRGRRTRLPSTRLYPASSIAEIESETSKFMWYKSGNVLYFSRPDSDLSTYPVVIPSTTVLSASKEKNVFLSNIDILYRPVLTEGLTGHFKDVSVGMVNAGGAIRYDDSISLTFERCEAYGCNRDGFNAHVVDTVTHVYSRQVQATFIDCYGHDNSDDGESCHEYCQISHHGGLYEYNGNGITPASGGHAVCYNVMTRKNGPHPWALGEAGTGFSAQGSSLDGGIGTNIYCFGCISDGDRISFRGVDNSSVFINCISRDAVSTAFGTGQQINCVTI